MARFALSLPEIRPTPTRTRWWVRVEPWVSTASRHTIKVLTAIRKHPMVTAVTPLGWATVVSAVVFAGIGWRFGWLEFRGLAVMAATILALALVVLLRRADHEVLLELHRPRVQAGEEALGRVLITPLGDRSAGAATMEFPVGKAVASFHVGSMGANDEHEEMFNIPARRRGVIPLGPVRSIRADPLGVVSRKKELTEQIELFIHPRIIAIEMGAVGILKDVEGITTSNLSSSDVSFHALREYVPGDDRRAVHWRTTARTGKLMVRQFEETMRAHLVLLLSTRNDDYQTPDAFELAVSVVGSMAASAMREERQVSVLTSTGELMFASTIGMLDELARLELSDKGLDHKAMAIKGGAIPGASVVGFVTGLTDPPLLRAGQLALPPGLFAFAVRCGEDVEMRRRSIGELPVLDLGALDQLRPALRSLR